MKTFADIIKAIFVKDLLSEFRTKQVLPAMIMLGVLIAWIFRIAAQSAEVNAPAIASAALLAAILFSAILVCEKNFAAEHENDCLAALLLASPDARDIYLAKLIVNVTILCAFELVAVPAVLVLFKINIIISWLRLIIVLLLVNVGFAGIATLLACAVQGTKTTNSLLGILVMAVLSPMMIPAVSVLISLFTSSDTAFDFNRILGFLFAFDAIFVTLCWLLFDFVVSG